MNGFGLKLIYTERANFVVVVVVGMVYKSEKESKKLNMNIKKKKRNERERRRKKGISFYIQKEHVSWCSISLGYK